MHGVIEIPEGHGTVIKDNIIIGTQCCSAGPTGPPGPPGATPVPDLRAISQLQLPNVGCFQFDRAYLPIVELGLVSFVRDAHGGSKLYLGYSSPQMGFAVEVEIAVKIDEELNRHVVAREFTLSGEFDAAGRLPWHYLGMSRDARIAAEPDPESFQRQIYSLRMRQAVLGPDAPLLSQVELLQAVENLARQARPA
jgi:hypothetical protein